ncbi:MAG: Crp/Fnr family transcriptional regulator [Flammeovirgaceae bacterium]
MQLAFFTEPELIRALEQNGRLKKFAQNDIVINPVDAITHVPIVLSGSLRIVREDEEGREVFLYHIHEQQSCAMSLNCCVAEKQSMVKAIAEDKTEVLMVPAPMVDQLMRFSEWRRFINFTYASRYNELLEVIDLIAFHNMDKQLLHYLKKRGEALNTTTLFITHQQIADELHTHREAISRLLRTMEEKKLVRLGRNTIEILD